MEYYPTPFSFVVKVPNNYFVSLLPLTESMNFKENFKSF